MNTSKFTACEHPHQSSPEEFRFVLKKVNAQIDTLKTEIQEIDYLINPLIARSQALNGELQLATVIRNALIAASKQIPTTTSEQTPKNEPTESCGPVPPTEPAETDNLPNPSPDINIAVVQAELNDIKTKSRFYYGSILYKIIKERGIMMSSLDILSIVTTQYPELNEHLSQPTQGGGSLHSKLYRLEKSLNKMCRVTEHMLKHPKAYTKRQKLLAGTLNSIILFSDTRYYGLKEWFDKTTGQADPQYLPSNLISNPNQDKEDISL
jgi:hypothetical protein